MDTSDSLPGMGTRRGNGEGSAPRKLPTGRWVGQIWVELPNGDRKRLTRRGATAAEVREKYREAIRETRAGVSPTTGAEDTVSAYADRWLDQKARGGMKPSALKEAGSVLRLYVLPIIGGRSIKSVRPADIDRILAAPDAAKKAPQTRVKIFRVTSSVFTTAEREGAIVVSPTRKVRAPSVAQHDPGTLALSRADMDKILVSAHEMGPTQEARAMLAFLGLRAAEALALDWTDVDFDRRRLAVRRARTRAKHVHGAGCGSASKHTAAACPLRVSAPLCQPPKSRAGRRVIHLSNPMLGVLKSAKSEQMSHRLPDVEPHPELTAPVIPGTDWVSPASVTTDSTRWRKMLSTLGFGAEVNLHSARHTAASLMLTTGTDIATVGAILGHSTLSSTAAYLHAQEEPSRLATSGLLDRVVGDNAAERRANQAALNQLLDDLRRERDLWREVGTASHAGESDAAWRARVAEVGLNPDHADPQMDWEEREMDLRQAIAAG